MKAKICVDYLPGTANDPQPQYKAWLANDPATWDRGKSFPEAIGNLLLTAGDGIVIENHILNRRMEQAPPLAGGIEGVNQLLADAQAWVNAQKKKIKTIQFPFSEAIVIDSNAIFTNWQDAESHVSKVSRPKYGYYKTDVVLTYEDDVEYRFRYDINEGTPPLRVYALQHIKCVIDGVYTKPEHKQWCKNFLLTHSFEESKQI